MKLLFLLGFVLLPLFVQEVDTGSANPAGESVCFHSPYHETVQDVHSISYTMFKMSFLC